MVRVLYGTTGCSTLVSSYAKALLAVPSATSIQRGAVFRSGLVMYPEVTVAFLFALPCLIFTLVRQFQGFPKVPLDLDNLAVSLSF